MYVTVERTRFGEWENFSAVVEVVEVVEWRVTLVRTASMPSPDAAALARSLARQTRVLDSLRRAREARDAELRRVMESLDRAGVA